MKIFFNARPKYSPWGGGIHFLRDLIELLNQKEHKVVFKLKKDIDLIFILANTKELNYKIIKYKQKNPDVKVLHRINECDKRKNTQHIDSLLFNTNKLADFTVFISKWLSEYFIEKGFNKSYKVIYNGCNSKYFYPEKDKKLGKKINLVTHHWSSNWYKGFDIYTKLDEILHERDDITFTYIGRYYKKYFPKNTKLIQPLYAKKLGDELRKCDIYLTASRWEPCGMHHIEGASCGLPVLYHKDGGGINESCKNYGFEYNNISTLLEGVDKIKKTYQEYRNKICYEYLNSERCCEEYYNTILEMI